jgi:hypothetical protein
MLTKMGIGAGKIMGDFHKSIKMKCNLQQDGAHKASKRRLQWNTSHSILILIALYQKEDDDEKTMKCLITC